jgi:hypothetical protein
LSGETATQIIQTPAPADVTVTVNQPAATPAPDVPLTSTVTTTTIVSTPPADNWWVRTKKTVLCGLRTFWEFVDAGIGGGLVFAAKFNLIQTAALIFTFWLTYDHMPQLRI